MATLVAVDNGSTAIKYCYKNQDGKLISGVFRSRYVDDLQMTNTEYSENAYELPEGSVSIDEQAAHPVKTNTPKYQYSKYTRAGVYEALRRTGLKGEIDLVITLPISHFYLTGSQGGIKKENIEKAKANILKPIKSANESIELPKVVSVKVYPEGVGALMQIISDEEGCLRDGFELEQKALIIDIGGSTVDIALLANLAGKIQSKQSIGRGVLTIIDEFKALAQPKLKANTAVTREFAESAFRGEKPLGLDFKAEVEQASVNFVDGIMREIDEMLDDPMLKHVIVCGGGANLSGKAIKQYIDQEGSGAKVTIPDDPEKTLVKSIHKHELARKEELVEEV